MPEYSTFRKSVYDPVLIVAQIVTLQCFGYSTFSILLICASILTSVELTPRLLFSSQSIQPTVEGAIVSASIICMGIMNIVPLVYMVERSRLCIDFSATFFLVHVIVVWWTQHQVPELVWWGVMAVAMGVMAVGGRAVCSRRELLPIAIRSLMPERRAEQGNGVDEEHELETRGFRPDELDTHELVARAPEAVSHEPIIDTGARSSGGWSDDWGAEELINEVIDQVLPKDTAKGHKDD
ncbi:hypothetical protein GGH12_001478 [Coemansia sp. RSA 1822]|nr:hypothetical protein LPJ76_004276 [Coemansia sp. RSA 638]KAJ2123857.1 hypothetical protein IW147_002288 [Coemansia sp. RSA 720]KAJ2539520.1 hypothetical protein GGF49_005166 [Coemansia sp. RSA 1853]KAJ2565312.1 hypothetical protein GGH12_001478 [Coemansia sp. RSA 1822]